MGRREGDDEFGLIDIVINPDVVQGQRLDVVEMRGRVVEHDQEGFLGYIEITIQEGRE